MMAEVPLSSTIIKAVGGLIASDGATGVPCAGPLGQVNVQAALDAIIDTPSSSVAWTNVTGKPSTFPSTIGEVSGLQANLDGKQPINSGLTAISSLATSTYGRNLLTLADAAALQVSANLQIGTNVQAYSVTLTSLGSASANGVSLITAVNYAAMRTLLGLGGAALLGIGTAAGTVAAGDDSRIVGAAQSLDTYNLQTGTTYTLQASDLGKLVICTNAAAITVTMPNSLVAGFNCIIRQGGAGQITVAPGSGATLNGYLGLKTAGQYAAVAFSVQSNAGSAAVGILDGGVA